MPWKKGAFSLRRRLKMMAVSGVVLCLASQCTAAETLVTEFPTPTPTEELMVMCYEPAPPQETPEVTPTPERVLCYDVATVGETPTPFLSLLPTPTPPVSVSPTSTPETPPPLCYAPPAPETGSEGTPTPEARGLLRERLLAEGRFPEAVILQLRESK